MHLVCILQRFCILYLSHYIIDVKIEEPWVKTFGVDKEQICLSFPNNVSKPSTRPGAAPNVNKLQSESRRGEGPPGYLWVRALRWLD